MSTIPFSSKPSRNRPILSNRRRWTFRFLAIGVGLLPFLLLEGGLRTTNTGKRSEWRDPHIGFDAIRPLFELNKGNDEYEIPNSRQEYFQRAAFPQRKHPDEFRIFCLGGSTVQGRPYAVETSFTTWLELSLKAAEPKRRWRVVNCGGVSYASYRLVPILKETLQYQPDLFVVLTGHNEFLEDRTYQNVKQTHPIVRRAHDWLEGVRSYNLCRSVYVNLTNPVVDLKNVLPAEVDAKLDYRGGLADYERDDQWRDGVVQHFGGNIRRMIRHAQDADVPIVFLNPACNLNDCPPIKMSHGNDVHQQQKREFKSLWNKAKQTDLSLEDKVALLDQAVVIDPRHAGVHYHLGKCLEALGRTSQARESLIRAKDEDICPLRIVEDQRRLLTEIAAETETPLVDLVPVFQRHSHGKLLGKGTFVDHVHPTIEGHKWIAAAVQEQMQQLGLVVEAPDWEERRAQLYLKHVQSLDKLYFVRAKERLAGLRRWAEGRAMKVR